MKIKTLSLAVASATLLVAASASANQSLNKPGYSATIGGVSNISTVHSSSHNPAANNLLIGKGEKLRFGYVSNLGIYVELGAVKDLDKKIDGIVDDLDAIENDIKGGQITTLPQLQGRIDAYENKVNGFLQDELNKAGQFRAGAHVNLPLLPFLVRSDLARGTFSVNADYSVQTKGVMLMDDIKVDNLPTAIANQKLTVTTNSGLDMRAAQIGHASLGYGSNLADWDLPKLPYGELEVGARLNLYSVKMGRSFYSFQKDINDSNNNDDFSDNLTDDLFDNTKSSSKVSLDIGTLWHTDSFQTGLTVYNLNEPKFDSPDMATQLKDPTDLLALQNMATAGKAKIRDDVKLTRHAVIEAAYFPIGRQLSIQGYATAGKATNFVGDKSQYVGASIGYFPDSWFIPAVRAGYNKNLAGTKLSTINAGATMFGMFNLDVAMSTQKSSLDGTSLPRYLAVSIGLEEKF